MTTETDDAMSTGRSTIAGPTPVLVTPEGISQYITCRRAWWLAEAEAKAPGEEQLAAQSALARRLRLSKWLAVAGGAMIALAVLIVILGLVVS